eukprot:30154-Prorocentrum_lima.AAC.1
MAANGQYYGPKPAACNTLRMCSLTIPTILSIRPFTDELSSVARLQPDYLNSKGPPPMVPQL